VLFDNFRCYPLLRGPGGVALLPVRADNAGISDKVVITGTLIDIPVKLPDCGVFCYVVACRLKESITNKTVILFIPCPELYGKDFFKKDRLYEAHLLPDESKYKDCVKSNRFQGQKAPLYYVDDIKKMENK